MVGWVQCFTIGDLLPELSSFIGRICSGFAVRPFFGSPEAGVFRLFSRWRAGCAIVVQQRNRGSLPDRPVRAFLIVVLAPILQLFLRICKTQEPVTFKHSARKRPLNASMKALSGMMSAGAAVLGGAKQIALAHPGLGAPGARKCGQAVVLT